MPEVNGRPAGNGGSEQETLTQEDVAVMETLLDLDDIENMDFDSIEDPPGFVTPPNGIYDLKITKGAIEKYKTRDEPGVERKRFANYYEILHVVELDDAAEQEPKVGDKFSERFMMNENGMKYWKGKAKAILGEVGKVSVANVLKELSSGNYSFRCRITNKKSMGAKGTSNEKKEFTNTNVKVIGKAGEIPGLGQAAGTTQAAATAGEVLPEA